MTSQAAKGKHTRLSDADLVTLARDGHTPEQIGAATGITAAHIVTRLRRLGLGNDGQPYVEPTPVRERVVSWDAGRDESWRGDAACFTGGHDPELWFMTEKEDEAKAICFNECPVRTRCLEAALRAEAGMSHQYRGGVFGGLTVRERMALDSEAVA